jgi:hypothetical protein
MCIFFIPPQCPVFYYNQLGDHQDDLIARHIQGALTNSSTTYIGRCFNPTSSNPFACCNPKLRIQVRHQSNELGDCEQCTAFARVWQHKLLKGAVDLVDEDDKPMTCEDGLAALGELARTMMVRRTDQVVKKGECLCEHAESEEGDHVLGDETCGTLKKGHASDDTLVETGREDNDVDKHVGAPTELAGGIDSPIKRANKPTNAVDTVTNGVAKAINGVNKLTKAIDKLGINDSNQADVSDKVNSMLKQRTFKPSFY